MPLSFQHGRSSYRGPPEPVTAIVDPPNPICELKLPHKTPQAVTLREVAKTIMHEGWGVWQWDPVPKTWSTIHKDSTPSEPKLSCDPLTVLPLTKQAFDVCAQYAGSQRDREV